MSRRALWLKKLDQLRKDQLLTLARAFNLDVSEAMRKADIIDEIVSNRLKEAYEFFVNLEEIKEKLDYIAGTQGCNRGSRCSSKRVG